MPVDDRVGATVIRKESLEFRLSVLHQIGCMFPPGSSSRMNSKVVVAGLTGSSGSEFS